MTADNYRQIVPRENSLGLHYSGLADLTLGKSATYMPKISKPTPNPRSQVKYVSRTLDPLRPTRPTIRLFS
jgi:hypothetical protein